MMNNKQIAEKQGYEDCMNEKPSYANPYSNLNFTEFLKWDMGWARAKQKQENNG